MERSEARLVAKMCQPDPAMNDAGLAEALSLPLETRRRLASALLEAEIADPWSCLALVLPPEAARQQARLLACRCAEELLSNWRMKRDSQPEAESLLEIARRYVQQRALADELAAAWERSRRLPSRVMLALEGALCLEDERTIRLAMANGAVVIAQLNPPTRGCIISRMHSSMEAWQYLLWLKAQLREIVGV